MSTSKAHILVIRLSAMGDVAMTVPVLKALTKAYPNTKVTVLTRAFFTPFFTQLPNVSVKVIALNGEHKGVFGLRKLYSELKKEGIDAVADLHNVLRSNILKQFFKFSKIPFEQIDKGRDEKKALTSWKNKVFKALTTTHQRYVNVFESLGFSFSLSAEDILVRESLDTPTNQLAGINTKKWIGIAPFAQHEGKEYSYDLMLQIIDELNKKNEYRILLFGGGKKETQLLQNTAQKFKHVACVAGELTIRQELDLISNLDVMLSMDSGNGHLAAMYGIPVVTIWGVTHPYAGFAPFAQPEANNILPDLVVYDKIPTSIYGNKVPDGYENVMQSILPETVLERIIDIIG
ncbi:glycosyltransferase family 9 protein [Aquimarina agarilytica]|uniref:glycosyltransferase family 9 protein n=1 Tax=Aquimarina agarilytica TaxID=1087449 RepID=UPI0002887F53|nr:glycosyltransferase family 9 protein [Aquimarina agarilytica]